MKLVNKLIEQRLFHYAISGGTAFTIEYGSFLIFYYEFHLSAVLANTISFSLGLVTSFLLNRFWVFAHDKQKKKMVHQMSLYLVTGLFNLIITDIMIHFIVKAGVPAFIAKILLVIIVAFWNFFIFKRIIFMQQKTDMSINKS